MAELCSGITTTMRPGPNGTLVEVYFCAGTTFDERKADPSLYHTSKEAVKCPFSGFCQSAIDARKNNERNHVSMHREARSGRSTTLNTRGAPQGRGNPDKTKQS